MISRRSFFALIGLGAVAQMAEHLPRKQTVFGSNPNGTSRYVQASFTTPVWSSETKTTASIVKGEEDLRAAIHELKAKLNAQTS